MTRERVSLRTVDLDNCDKEPIQIPGSVQPHGVLLALAHDGTLTHASRNAAAMFAQPPPLGQRPTTAQLWSSAPLREAAEGILEDAATAGHVPPLAVEATLDGSHYDVVLHAHAGHLLMEFERRATDASELASFAVMAHRSMSRLRGRPDIASVLAEAVLAVRQLTGFDRVMAYRFHGDDSGEVVAEARIDALEPYLGRRFPATDIPVQARRLYVINTLRLIADVHDEQVPIDAFDPLEAPLDLSYSILRSVSPIHIEYLKNIGVAASMSVSIVIGGKLWGLIACHHRTAHRVTYAVRMACDVLAGVVGASVQLLLEKDAGARRAAAVDLRARLVELGADVDEVTVGMSPSRVALGRVIPNDRVLFAHGSVLRHEGIDATAAGDLLLWLEAQTDDLVALNNFSSLPEALRARLHPLSGLLAMRHDRINRGWVVLLRNEQSATITWSGPPDKAARVGPLGARLTPDGSLAEWRQEVRGSAMPWDDLDLELARQIMEEVRRATALRAADMERARSHLLAILGHDLRDPLAAVRMAAYMLERGSDREAIGRRIAATTGRMGRLIAQVLDMSRLHGGMGLGLVFVRTNVSEFIGTLIEETATAYPDVAMHVELGSAIEADVDRDRLAQAVVNLIGNARQHGAIGETVTIRLRAQGDRMVFDVANVAPPLADALRKGLFDPLKRNLLPNQRNPNGLGLGLYIANEAIKGHDGSIHYSHDGRNVVFAIDLPLARQAPAA
jgi:two-component system, chemotaxis family, sensor kinase Cph1